MMYNIAVKLISVLLIFLLPYTVYGQQAEAPVYEDGDWWRVKVEFEHLAGFSRSSCFEDYPEYLVKIEQGKTKVYGLIGTFQEEIDCPRIANEVLGKGPSGQEMGQGPTDRLKFPLSLGDSWSSTMIGETVDRTYPTSHEVLAWEKVRTPIGVFDAFKIRLDWANTPTATYYYAPKAKAIVRLNREVWALKRTVTLVDSNLVRGRKDLKGPQIVKKFPETQQPAKPKKDVASLPEVPKPRQDILLTVPKREGKRFAVLIGIGDYQDTSIPDLAYATADARSIYNLLTDPSRGGFPKENVKLLLGREATRRSIVVAIGDWLFRRAGPEDEVFVYYAGHGAVEKDRTGTEPDGLAKYLVPADADPKTLFVTGISNGELARMFQALKTKRLVFFLDSCYSAGTTGLGRALTPTGFRAGSLSSDLYGRLAGTGQAIVAAAKPNQVALEIARLGHGLFTKFVLDGLQGRADANGDGYVTLLELYPYLSREVPEVARQEGGIQEPVLMGSIAGDLVLASVPETLRQLSIETRIGRLKKLYLEEAISVKQYDKAVQILKSDQRDRILEDFLKGDLSLSTFRESF